MWKKEVNIYLYYESIEYFSLRPYFVKNSLNNSLGLRDLLLSTGQYQNAIHIERFHTNIF